MCRNRGIFKENLRNEEKKFKENMRNEGRKCATVYMTINKHTRGI